MARTEANVYSDAAIEVPLHYDGTKFRPEVPAGIVGDHSHAAAYVGDLPRPGTATTCGGATPWRSRARTR